MLCHHVPRCATRTGTRCGTQTHDPRALNGKHSGQPTGHCSDFLHTEKLVSTCISHGVNPHTYLMDVLIRIQTHPQSG